MTPYEAASQLLDAATAGQTEEVARYLDDFPVLITLPVGVHGLTLLHKAACEGLDDVIHLLVQRGVPIDLVADGRTALHCAIREGPLSSIQLLLRSGADPNKPTDAGASPLALVAIGRASAGEDDEEQVAEALLQHGAAPE